MLCGLLDLLDLFAVCWFGVGNNVVIILVCFYVVTFTCLLIVCGLLIIVCCVDCIVDWLF